MNSSLRPPSLDCLFVSTMSTQSNSLRLADRLVKQGYAWPGGYPMFAISNDGECLCKHCCYSERELIGTTTGSDGWCIVALDINFEDSLTCSNCGKQIEAAYDD